MKDIIPEREGFCLCFIGMVDGSRMEKGLKVHGFVLYYDGMIWREPLWRTRRYLSHIKEMRLQNLA